MLYFFLILLCAALVGGIFWIAYRLDQRPRKDSDFDAKLRLTERDRINRILFQLAGAFIGIIIAYLGATIDSTVIILVGLGVIIVSLPPFTARRLF